MSGSLAEIVDVGVGQSSLELGNGSRAEKDVGVPVSSSRDQGVYTRPRRIAECHGLQQGPQIWSDQPTEANLPVPTFARGPAFS